jgi:hypothetical protein
VGAAVDAVASAVSAASASASAGWIQCGWIHAGTRTYPRNAMSFTSIKIGFLKTWYSSTFRNTGILESLSVGPSFSTPQKRPTWSPILNLVLNLVFFFIRFLHHSESAAAS